MSAICRQGRLGRRTRIRHGLGRSTRSPEAAHAIAKALTRAGKLYSPPTPTARAARPSPARPDVLRAKKALTGVDVKRVTSTPNHQQSVLMPSPSAELDQPLIDPTWPAAALDYLVASPSRRCCGAAAGSRSAGRVQSVALRLICEREAEIEVFKIANTGRSTRSSAPPRSRPESSPHPSRRPKLDKFDLDTGERADQASARSSAAPSRAVDRPRQCGAIRRRLSHLDPAARASRKLGLGAATAMRSPSGSTRASISRRGRWTHYLYADRRRAARAPRRSARPAA